MWNGRGEPDRRRALFGGTGEVRVWSMLPQVPAPFDCVLGCELDAGGSVGPHVQDRCSEVVIVTEGRGQAFVDDDSFDLMPGSVVPLPLGATLALNNASDTEPLRYFIVKAALESGS
jgi:mannose-6-phosphate isomerase-like protein (cupin superfamily)